MAQAPRRGGGGHLKSAKSAKSAERAPRTCFAVVAPGLEAVAAAELRALGLAPGALEAGGVNFATDDAGLFRANLHLRSVSRVLVRVAEFKATAFHELERLARGVAWEDFITPGGAVRLRVTCKKSRLYHSDGVAERVEGAIAKRVKVASVTAAAKDDDVDADENAAQLFIVRFLHDLCTISADSSGELLHRRGYRLAVAKAPLRETLAAGLLQALEWNPSIPLLDPMCGSGTFAIEAALMSRRIAPGLGRAFSCERWPGAAARMECSAQRKKAHADQLLIAAAPIIASDRDAGAVEATLANAERAGVAADIEVRQCALSAIEPPPNPGLLVVNPPYGGRVGEGVALRNLYAQLGNVVRAKCAGWTLGLLSADRGLERQVKLPFQELIKFKNGGIPVRLVRAPVPRR